MGKLNHDQTIQHFSHPHLLQLCNLDQQQLLAQQITAPCSGCKLQPYGFMYTCGSCNFNLHLSCTQFPQLITHPSHPNHTLSLLPIPLYPGGHFNCDACNHTGNGFSYHCTPCDFDLHVLCASKPLTIAHQSHRHHPLELTFNPPYESKAFSCDICHRIGSKQWLYRCSACEFDVHLDCAAAMPKPILLGQPQPQQLLQNQHSFPVTGTNSRSQALVTGGGNGNVPLGPGYYMHSASTGSLQMYQQPPPTHEPGNSLMNVAVQGFNDGAAQQVGQNVVQSMMGGGNDGGSGGGGTGDLSSASIFNVGSSILGSIFGDSNTQN
ncbi:unnamed protein product [Ilex paraguariensis]|uniref:DC1 domain-containing protein n=1 Tax=Ilex paraguariensis TaxID=185542 RepID=A0ABC8R008_9AQUA